MTARPRESPGPFHFSPCGNSTDARQPIRHNPSDTTHNPRNPVMGAPVSDDELAKAYRLALNYAKRQAGSHGDETAEALQDAATDGVMNARDRFDPARCTAGFGPFCMAVVKTRVRRAQRRLADRRRREPSHSPLPEDFPARELPAAGGVPMTPDLRDLPPDLRDTVRLVYVDGYSYEDAGLLLGVSNFTVSERLRRAAHMLAPDGAERPERRPKEKRVRGGKGH